MITALALDEAIRSIDAGRISLPFDVLSIHGLSSAKVKALLNWLCSQPDTNYLEVGVYLGSTFIPAIYGNNCQATAIDNWCQFKGKRPQFEENLRLALPDRHLPASSTNLIISKQAGVKLIDADSFTVDLREIPQGVNVYFYDGDHAQSAQRAAFTYFDPVLAPRFVAVVDDWSWQAVRDGTRAAFDELGYRVIQEWELPGEGNGDRANWWNGLLVAICLKSTMQSS